MKKYAAITYFLTFVISILLGLSVQANENAILVTPDWLAQRLDNPNTVVLHIGTEDTYQAGHIPGAFAVDLTINLSRPDSHFSKSPFQEFPLALELPAIEDLQTLLRKFGVNQNSSIVLYWSGNDITGTTRALFTLDWAGLGKQSYFLDGGLDAWKRANKTISTEATPLPQQAGDLVLTPQNNLIVDADWVQANQTTDDIALVDARPKSFYDGLSSYHPIKGHIAGSGSTPYTEFVNEDLSLRDTAALREIFSKGGVSEDDTVVAYCHLGQFATVAILAARLLGHEVKLYDGAFQDWAIRELPTVQAAE